MSHVTRHHFSFPQARVTENARTLLGLSTIVTGLLLTLMALLTGCITNCFAQNLTPDILNDTLPVKTLDSVTVSTRLKQFNASYLTDVVGTKVYAGKRTNTLTLSQNINDLSSNLG